MVGVVDGFCGIACDPGGRPVAGWLARRGGKHRVAALDDGGEPVWSCEVPGLTAGAALVGGSDGALLLAADAGVNRLHVIDAAKGKLVRRLEGTAASVGDDPPDQSRPLCLQGHRGVALDPADGTVVVLARSAASRERLLMRFKADGTSLPMWGKRRRNRRASVISLLMGPANVWDPPPWDEVGDRILVPPVDAIMTVGADGLLYLVSPELRRLAAWDRSGVLQFNRELEPSFPVFDIDRLAADTRGVVYATTRLAMPAGPHAHVIRISPEGAVELFLGPRSDNPSPLGPDDRHLAVDREGSVFVAGGLRSLRIFDDNGLLRWRSPATERADAEISG